MEVLVQRSLDFWKDIGRGSKSLGLSHQDAPPAKPPQAVRRQPLLNQLFQPAANVAVLPNKGNDSDPLTDFD